MNVLITGANRGIGLEMTKIFLKDNAHVFAVCRERTKELSDLESPNLTILSEMDLTNDSNLEKIHGQVSKAGSLDLIINNAGIFLEETLANMDFNAIEKQFQINTMAPLKLSYKLLPLMKAGSKIGILTSRMGSIADNTSGGYYGYRISKAAANAAFKSLAIDLENKQIAVAMLHPGYVKTKMTGFNGDITPDQAASGLVNVMKNLELKNTGKFWTRLAENLPW